ncbi:MAG: hypothetical protein ABI743_11055 [bacterium]
MAGDIMHTPLEQLPKDEVKRENTSAFWVLITIMLVVVGFVAYASKGDKPDAKQTITLSPKTQAAEPAATPAEPAAAEPAPTGEPVAAEPATPTETAPPPEGTTTPPAETPTGGDADPPTGN